MAVLTFTPSSYDSVNSSYNTSYNSSNDNATNGVYDGLVPSNGCGSESNATRTCVFSNTGNGVKSYLTYSFDCSSIPNNATIDSVSCTAKASFYKSGSTTYFSSQILQLYNGTTAKGSTASVTGNGSSGSTHTFDGGTWTRDELQNAKIRYTVTRSSGSSSAASFSFWGATLTVNYSYQGITYQITSVSNTDLVDSIDPEGTTDVTEGGDYTLNIYADDISNVVVEDNGTDVTSQLVQKQNANSDSTVLGAYTLISGGFNSSGASYFQGIVGKGADGSQTTNNYYSSGSGTITVFTYELSFSNVPSNAVITRLYVEVNGHAESTSRDNEYMCVQLRSENTELSSELNFKSIGTSNTTQTIEATTLPTVAQLENLVLYCRLGYYGGAINGATCYIEYTTPNQYFWQYTLSNVNDDHTIYVTESVVIPPDEDPQKTYYPVTISSINATTEPNKGTTRVESGTTETITIYPSDPLLSLAIDNGVDITSQLVRHGGVIPDPTVTTAPGASYGFNLNSSTGYYVSANKGVNKSASVCRVSFNLPVRCLVTLQFINYAEATYDFGVFGNIDVSLSTAYYSAGSGGATITDTDYKLACNTSSHNTSSTQTLTYEIPSGAHYIDIKFSKDDATSKNNDTLQWKITDIEPLEANDYYTYTLSNISEQHSLIFIFGNVTYYFVNSSTNSNSKLFPNGQMVQLPGDDYRLVIIPEDNNDTVTVTDNNTDVTAQLERKEVTTEKEGVSTTVVNYIYRLTDIQATHNIVVSSSTGTKNVYIKDNGWVSSTDILKKDNGRWSEIRYTRIWIHNGTEWIEDEQRAIPTKGMITQR